MCWIREVRFAGEDGFEGSQLVRRRQGDLAFAERAYGVVRGIVQANRFDELVDCGAKSGNRKVPLRAGDARVNGSVLNGDPYLVGSLRPGSQRLVKDVVRIDLETTSYAV